MFLMALLERLGAAATPFEGGQGQLPVSVNQTCNDTRDRRWRFRCNSRGAVWSGWRKCGEARQFSRGMASFPAWGSGWQYREPGVTTADNSAERNFSKADLRHLGTSSRARQVSMHSANRPH